jgi:glutamine amidotransferase
VIGIVDYGLGNLAAFEVAFKRLGRESMRITSPGQFDDADQLILPGVGAFDVGMTRLANSGLKQRLIQTVEAGRPVLGVCVGMQMLADGSEEGSLPGLSLVPGRVRKFTAGNGATIRCPHMGWNAVEAKRDLPITEGVGGQKFYFLHSYYFDCADENDVGCTAEYGAPFAAMTFRKNVYGVQFHPEKSHDAGLRLLENFALLTA